MRLQVHRLEYRVPGTMLIFHGAIKSKSRWRNFCAVIPAFAIVKSRCPSRVLHRLAEPSRTPHKIQAPLFPRYSASLAALTLQTTLHQIPPWLTLFLDHLKEALVERTLSQRRACVRLIFLSHCKGVEPMEPMSPATDDNDVRQPWSDCFNQMREVGQVFH